MSIVFLPVTARINLSSQQRAEGISAELYNLTLPKHLHEPDRTTTKMLGIMQHPTTGQWACVADTDLTILVHPEKNVTALVSLFPQLTMDERAAMTYYISTNAVVEMKYLIPSDTERLSEEEAFEAGWFPE